MFDVEALKDTISLLGFYLGEYEYKEVGKGIVKNQVGTESLSEFIDHRQSVQTLHNK